MIFNRYFATSAAVHLLILGLVLFGPWFNRQGPVFISEVDYAGSGGGAGEGTAAMKKEVMGQVVPNPLPQPVPEKPAPVQKATIAEETIKVRDAKPTPTPKPRATHPPTPPPVAERAEKTQKETSNIIRIGTPEKPKVGQGFDFGEGTPAGKGIGIGIGDETGPGGGGTGGSGFGGFGAYLRIVRQAIWNEWTQSAVYGSNRSCIVGLTIARDGSVSDIKLEKGSGDSFYDNVAMRAVRNASPLPRLPSDFPRAEQRFRIQFRLTE